MKLNELNDNQGARKDRLRVGRGIGSTKGKTAGRGHKGQKSRSGVAIKGFEGGQMPFYRRVPKHGFVNVFKINHAEINVSKLQDFIDRKKLDVSNKVTIVELQNAGLVRSSVNSVRILGNGELKSKIDLVVNGISSSAKDAIEKLGGSVEVILTDKQIRKAEKKSK